MVQYGKTSETTEEQYDNMMNVNVKAVFFLSKLIAPELIKTKGEGSLFFSFNTCRKFGFCITWIRPQQPQEQRYPFLPVCEVFCACSNNSTLPVFGIFNMHMDVHACDCTEGLANTVRESALKVDCGREIHCHSGD